MRQEDTDFFNCNNGNMEHQKATKQTILTSKEDAQLLLHVQPSPSAAHHHLPALQLVSQQRV
jgi:hypothetical protein